MPTLAGDMSMFPFLAVSLFLVTRINPIPNTPEIDEEHVKGSFVGEYTTVNYAGPMTGPKLDQRVDGESSGRSWSWGKKLFGSKAAKHVSPSKGTTANKCYKSMKDMSTSGSAVEVVHEYETHIVPYYPKPKPHPKATCEKCHSSPAANVNLILKSGSNPLSLYQTPYKPSFYPPFLPSILPPYQAGVPPPLFPPFLPPLLPGTPPNLLNQLAAALLVLLG